MLHRLQHDAFLSLVSVVGITANSIKTVAKSFVFNRRAFLAPNPMFAYNCKMLLQWANSFACTSVAQHVFCLGLVLVID